MRRNKFSKDGFGDAAYKMASGKVYRGYGEPKRKRGGGRLGLIGIAILLVLLGFFLVNIVAPSAGDKFGYIGAGCFLFAFIIGGWALNYKEDGTYNNKGVSDIFKDSRRR